MTPEVLEKVKALMRERRLSFHEACSEIARHGAQHRRKMRRQGEALERGRRILERMHLD